VSVTYGARDAASSSRAERIAELVDRFFVLFAVGFFLLLPTSGWASVMFGSWFDQKRDLAALRSVIADGHARAIADNGIGPAYIALAALVHDVLGLSPEDALVFLTRASYVLAIACGVLLVRILVRRLTTAPPLVSLAAQFAFVGLVFAAGTWHWSDVPWSHFLAAFLAVALYAVRFVPGRVTIASAAAVGVLLSLLWLTRSFELAAVVAAWGITFVVLRLLRLHGARVVKLVHVASGAAAFVVTTAAVYLVTGKRDLFFLYGGSLGHQSGNVSPGEIAETPTFSVSLVPAKLVQLFVDPCYDTLCSVSDYAGSATLPPQLTGDAGNLRLWSLPLAVQLPSLVLLPLCLLVAGALTVMAARKREASGERVRSLRLMLEATIASAGLVLGYAASTMTGAPHLRYGFARDFLMPALLTGVVGVALVSVGLWTLLSAGRRRRLSPEFAFGVLAFAGSACLVVALAYARSDGIPRIESHQLGSVVYRASCSGDDCDVSIAATTTAGHAIAIPEASTLTFGCGSDDARFTLYEKSPTSGVRLTQPCPDARLVAAWPTVMGLPPGSFELEAVKVENAKLS
jgi:hypothetical protein